LEVCVLLSLLVALLVSTLVTQATVFATTIYLHRTVTHRSLVLHPAVAWIFRAWIWFTTIAGIGTSATRPRTSDWSRG
jgi:fatty-acid desaturase